MLILEQWHESCLTDLACTTTCRWHKITVTSNCKHSQLMHFFHAACGHVQKTSNLSEQRRIKWWKHKAFNVEYNADKNVVNPMDQSNAKTGHHFECPQTRCHSYCTFAFCGVDSWTGLSSPHYLLRTFQGKTLCSMCRHCKCKYKRKLSTCVSHQCLIHFAPEAIQE